MKFRAMRLAPAAIAALLVAGCAGDGGNGFLSTSSVVPPAIDAPKPTSQRYDPACVTLANQIDGLRKDGTIDRLEKVATGKGDTTPVKRTALAKQAELNKINAEFQVKCGPKLPSPTQAAAPAPGQAVAAVAPAAAAAKTPVVAKAAAAAATSGVTVATPTAPKVQ